MAPESQKLSVTLHEVVGPGRCHGGEDQIVLRVGRDAVHLDCDLNGYQFRFEKLAKLRDLIRIDGILPPHARSSKGSEYLSHNRRATYSGPHEG